MSIRFHSQHISSSSISGKGKKGHVAKIASDTFVYTGATVASQFLSIIRGIIVANVLGPAMFGIWKGLGYIAAYSPYSNLGLFVGMSREYAYLTGKGDLQKAGEIRDTAFSFGTLMACLVSLILIVVALLVKERYSPVIVVGICAMAVGTLFGRIYMFHVAIYRLKKRIGEVCLAILIEAVLYFGIAVALVNSWGMYALFLAFPLSCVISVLYLFLRSDEHFGLRFDFRQLYRMARIGLPLDVGGFAITMMSTLDGIVILIFLSATQMGYYGVGTVFVGIALQVPNSLAWIISPYLIERYGKTDDIQTLATYWIKPTLLLACTMPLVIGIIALSMPLLIRHILPAYLPGIMPAHILLWGSFFYSMTFAAANFLLAVDRQVQFTLIMCGAAVLNIVLLYVILSFGLGIEGVALARALSYLVHGSVVLGYAMRYYIKGAFALTMFLVRAYMPVTYAILLVIVLEVMGHGDSSSLASDFGATLVKVIGFCLLYSPVLYLSGRKLGLFDLIAGSIKHLKSKMQV